jgi:hypothetical protein
MTRIQIAPRRGRLPRANTMFNTTRAVVLAAMAQMPDKTLDFG